MAVGLIGTLVAVWFASSMVGALIEEERDDRTRSVVQAAMGVVTAFGEEERAGRMTRAPAQRQAILALRTMRYAGTEYFWINDLRPVVVMHPTRPEQVGKDAFGVVTGDGVHVYLEINRVARAQGQGFVSYNWPKPGSDTPQPKTSFVALYPPWEWVVGSGVYMDDVAAAARERALRLAAFAVLPILAMLGVGLVLSRSITRPLRRAIGTLHDADLTYRFDERGDGTEMDDLHIALNHSLDRVRGVIHGVESAVRLADATRSVADRVNAISASVEDLSNLSAHLPGRCPPSSGGESPTRKVVADITL